MRNLSNRQWSGVVLLLTAIATVGALAAIVDPFNPDLYCCDHLYYRGQAESWLGVGTAHVAEIPSANRFWGVIANNETYYDLNNGLDSQPPYVFRPLIPVMAGLLGHLIGINTAFYVITVLSLVVLGFFSGLTVMRLSGSIWLAVFVTVGAVLSPEVGNFNLFDFMLVDAASFAIVAVVLYLLATDHWMIAGIIASAFGPLAKETLVTLALTVSLAAFLRGVRSRWLLVFPLIPVVMQGILRLIIQVPNPPLLTEIFIPGAQIRAVETLMIAFIGVSFLFYGLISTKVRDLVVAFIPVFILLVVITSSSAADSPRIWQTIWPLILVLGSTGLAHFLNGSAERYLWIPIPLAALIWLHLGDEIHGTSQILYLILYYGLIIIPMGLIVLHYLFAQFQPRNATPKFEVSNSDNRAVAKK